MVLKVSKAAELVLLHARLWVSARHRSQPGIPALGHWVSLARTFVVALQGADTQIDVAWALSGDFFSSELASGRDSARLVFRK